MPKFAPVSHRHAAGQAGAKLSPAKETGRAGRQGGGLRRRDKRNGQIPEWPNGADCKSAGLRLRWFESIFAHVEIAEVAQLIEHQPSKLRVASLSLVFRSKKKLLPM